MPTRLMSIYLLKAEMTVDDALENDHGYREVDFSADVPNGTRIFIQVGKERQPWWRGYFGVSDDLKQQLNSGVSFVPCGTRIFALTFGSGQHVVRNEALDHEFGTRVVLNAVDPLKLKSTDTLDPQSSQRRRTQLPFDGDLALLRDCTDRCHGRRAGRVSQR